MPKYTVRPHSVKYTVTKTKTKWEKFLDAIALAGLGLIGFVIVCLILAASGS